MTSIFPSSFAQAESTPIEVLSAYATRRIEHLNRGWCPDQQTGFDSRDNDCPVCTALTNAGSVPSGNAQTGLQVVPRPVIDAITAYGDARADQATPMECGERLAKAIHETRVALERVARSEMMKAKMAAPPVVDPVPVQVVAVAGDPAASSIALHSAVSTVPVDAIAVKEDELPETAVTPAVVEVHEAETSAKAFEPAKPSLAGGSLVLLGAIEKRLTHLLVGRCSCHTKTPDVSFHHPTCVYRLGTEIDALVQSIRKIEGAKTASSSVATSSRAVNDVQPEPPAPPAPSLPSLPSLPPVSAVEAAGPDVETLSLDVTSWAASMEEATAPELESETVESSEPEMFVAPLPSRMKFIPVLTTEVEVPSPGVSTEDPACSYCDQSLRVHDIQEDTYLCPPPASLLASASEESQEIVGKRCKDGGVCHHECTSNCFRRDGFVCVSHQASGLADKLERPKEN